MYQEIRKLSYALIAILVVLGGLFVFQVDAIQAAVGINKEINFQGKVTNTDGTNVADGSYSFVFSIYSQQAPGGSVIWTETKSITVTDGIFQTNLGDTTVLPGSVDFNTDNIFLGINFNSNGEMSPRVQFTASPYAFNSDMLDGKDWTNPGTIGTSASTLGLASGGVSSWTNTAGNLTLSTATSGTLALTSAGALNLSAAAASTMALANVTNSFNFDSNTFSIDALNNRIGIGTNAPKSALHIEGSPLIAVGNAYRINAYYNSPTTSDKAVAAGFAADYYQNNSTGMFNFRTTSSSVAAAADLALSNRLSLDVNGGVAIGTYAGSSVPVAAANGLIVSGNVGIGTNSPTAFLDVAAATTGAASIRLEASAGVNPSAPNIGDMWFNGSNLYFRKDGSTSQDLLAAGGGGMANPMTTQGDLIFGGGSGTPTRLAGAGVDGYVLKYATGTNTPYWADDLTGGAAGPWTDGTGVSYLTDVNEDLAIGATTIAAPFSVDVSLNTVRVGSGATNNGKIEMYSSTGATGSIEYTNNDSWNFAGGNIGINNNNPDEALSVGSYTSRADAGIYGDITSEGYEIQKALAGIIDIFVYDTTRDSDGGEWRNSLISQQMSWATEAKDNSGANCVIATDDRCGKVAFPRKAIIATTANGLYIFDGADSTLWMKFTQDGTYSLGADLNNNPSGVGAQNGVIVVGTNGTAGSGMYAFDFKQDTMFRYNATNRVQGDKNIGNRNTAVTYATDPLTTFAILNAIVNDVSINLITSSTEGMANTLTLPLDSVAGPMRGMTLIAAATDSGVSVLNMATRRVLNYSDTANDDYNQVIITSRARMYTTNETLAQLEEWRNIDKDVITEAGGTPDRVYDETIGKSPITTGTVPVISTSPGALAVIERSSSAREAAATTLLETGDIVFVGTNQGLAEVHTSGGNLVTASWSKITTTTVATPYMIGGVRGAYLFDEAVGATAAVSAVGINGTTRNPMDSAAATAPTFGGNGVRGNSVNFNNNSYFCSDANGDGTCDSDTDFNAGTVGFTVSLWFRHSATAAADTLFERCYTPATPAVTVGCIYAGMTTTGAIRFGIDSLTTWTYGTTYDDMVTSTGVYNDNQWHHAVFTNTDTDICLYIDGKQAVACDSTIAATATMDAAQVLTVGGTCSGANCVTGVNFWDGSIDDFVWSSNAGTTADGIPSQGANKLYLDGRAHMIRPSANVTGATNFSATTIGNTSQSYIPGTFSGLVVELTGGTGAGQTRTIVSNDANTFTVYPSFTTPPDATTNYLVSPAKLYGSSNNVTAIAPDLPTNLNKIRKVFVGTSDGADGGGISVFTNAGSGGIKTEVIHSEAGYRVDDFGLNWSGAGSDNVTAIGAYSDTTVFGSSTFLRSQRKDVSLKQLQLDTLGGFEDIRQELVSKQLFGSTQDVLGLGQGADLAEYYNSVEPLDAGTIVVNGKGAANEIEKSTSSYQKNVLGVVATKPSMIMGPKDDTSYPVALSGRVPVNVTTENGGIMKGDQITTSSLSGFGMVAVESGRVIGMALETPDVSTFVDCPIETGLASGTKCGQVMVFVNLMDFSGMEIEDLMNEKGYDMLAQNSDFANLFSSAVSQDVSIETGGSAFQNDWKNIFKATNTLGFLKKLNDPTTGMSMSSEILAKNVNATGSVVSPLIVTDTLIAKHIKAESIEGLEFIQTGIDDANASSANNAAEVKTLGQQLSEIQNNLKALNEKVLGATTPADGLMVGGSAEFKGPAIFKTIAEFMDKVIFKNNVEFAGQVIFNKDMAGYAIIKEGTDLVDIEFEKEYSMAPIVNASLSLQSIEDEEIRKAAEQLLLVSDVKFVITNVTTKGLQIRIGQKAISDIPFSWQATAIKDAKTFESKIPVLNVDRKDLFVNFKTVTETVQNAVPQVLPVEKTEVPMNINVENQQVAGAETASTTN